MRSLSYGVHVSVLLELKKTGAVRIPGKIPISCVLINWLSGSLLALSLQVFELLRQDQLAISYKML